MDYSPEIDTPDWKALAGVLQRGRESTIRLQTLLQKPFAERGSVSSVELIAEIDRSFSESIAMVTSCDNGISGGARRVSPVDRSLKVPDQSKKRLGVKDRRGCYRRRNSGEPWVTFSSTAEDQYAWRKYGQKVILDTKFPRCYFRCTHKNEQLCKATKQVQQISDDPLEYRITYFGHHTCQNTSMRIPKIISEPEPIDQGSYILSFETKMISRNAHAPRPPQISSTVNQEFKEEALSDITECFDSSMWTDNGETSGIQKFQTASNAKTDAAVSYNDQEAVSSFHPSDPSTPLQNAIELEALGPNFDYYRSCMEELGFNNIDQFHN